MTRIGMICTDKNLKIQKNDDTSRFCNPFERSKTLEGDLERLPHLGSGILQLNCYKDQLLRVTINCFEGFQLLRVTTNRFEGFQPLEGYFVARGDHRTGMGGHFGDIVFVFDKILHGLVQHLFIFWWNDNAIYPISIILKDYPIF